MVSKSTDTMLASRSGSMTPSTEATSSDEKESRADVVSSIPFACSSEILEDSMLTMLDQPKNPVDAPPGLEDEVSCAKYRNLVDWTSHPAIVAPAAAVHRQSCSSLAGPVM